MPILYLVAEDGEPDRLRPMTKEEAIEAYWQLADDDPTSLADLYIDFHNFTQIEFVIFRDRLSSAILMSNAAKQSIMAAASRLEAMRADGSHISPGWETESEEYLDEMLHVTQDAYRISIGATIVTAVAALESLLIDLTPDAPRKPRGLSRLLQGFLERYRVSRPQAEHITNLSRTVSKRRNTFAHSLYGSYWETDPSIASMFTSETMEDTLYGVGRIAVLLDDVVQVGVPRG